MPVLFEHIENGRTGPVTVTEHYLNMLQDFALLWLQEHDIENIIFMQDGVPPHIISPVE